MPSDGSRRERVNEALEVVGLESRSASSLTTTSGSSSPSSARPAMNPAHDRAAAGSRRRLE